MTQDATVAVITRTKDRLVLLKRAIESVLGQTYPHWRMVIVNDGGQCGPVDQLVEHYVATSNGRIRVVHNSGSRGMHGASAVGFEQAEGGMVAIHDDDDSWAPEFLAVAIMALRHVQKDFPSVRGVTTYCNRVLERVQGNLVQTEFIESFSGWIPPGMLSLDRMLAGNIVPSISFVFERSAFDALDGIYEEVPYQGDWGFLVRFLVQFDVYMVPQHLAFWHWRTGAGTELGNSVTAEPERHQFYRQVLLNRWLRVDLAAGRFGVGCYANLRAHLQTIGERS